MSDERRPYIGLPHVADHHLDLPLRTVDGAAPDGRASQGRGPKNYRRSDERIREDICEHLPHLHYVDAGEIIVEVSDAQVTLIGTVPHRGLKHWIEDLAAGTPGVRDVDNKLRVALTAPWPTERKP